MRRLAALAIAVLAACGAPDAQPTETLAAESASCGATTVRVHTLHVGGAFVGYGAQFDQNLYAANTAAAGVTAQGIATVEQRMDELAPAHVRIFFDSDALGDADLMQSFVRTAELAQRAGATINVTWWHGPYPHPVAQMQAFAAVLDELVRVHGVAAVRYVTVQNEVNSTKVTPAEYEALVRALDGELRARKLRSHIAIVGGDLLQEDEATWFAYMGAHMADVLDGYSIHVYWAAGDEAKFEKRFAEVRSLVAAMPQSARKPLFVTEYGMRGTGGDGDPGTYDGAPTEGTIEAALEQARFDVEAARAGIVATVKWDAYFAMYDAHVQRWSMVLGPADDYATTPSFRMARLLAHTVDPGMRALAVDEGAVRASAFDGNGSYTVHLLETGACARSVVVEGLPPNRLFYHVDWNGDGKGGLAAHPRLRSDGKGRLAVTVPARGLVSLSTALPGLGL